MELNGDLLIDAPRDRVWLALNDPAVLMRSIPGCEEVQPVSATERHVRVLTKLGPVRARFVGKVLLSEVRPNEGCVLAFEGSGGAAGFAKGRSSVELADEALGTRLRYTAQATVGGKLGQIGGRLIDASAKQMADQFFVAFAREVNGEADVAASARSASAAAPAASSIAPASAPSAVALAPVRSAALTASRPEWPKEIPLPQALAGEGTRILWFVLGAASTAFGFWVAASVFR
jgi:carbon monoxide dehydrogenase subunit G